MSVSDTMTSPFSTGVRLPPSQVTAGQQSQQPPQPPAPAPPPAAAGVSGRIVGKFSKEPLCAEHFPGPAELTRLAHGATYGRPAPFVGTGDPYTALSCAHSDLPWRLGDHLVYISAPCLTGSHERCLDKACRCECQGGDAARAIAAAADNSLADALRQISATFAPQADPRLADALKVIEGLQAKVTALEAGKATCAGTRADGGPCGATPAKDSPFCARHADQG